MADQDELRESGPVNEPAQPDMLSFRALAATMFQGAFNDNAYKFLLFLYVAQIAGDDLGKADRLRGYTSFAFVIPWILFSMASGQLADRFSKSRITVWTKVWEVGIMLLGAVALYNGQTWFSLVLLGMMAFQSTVFGPAKYGLLPEIMPEKRLSWANGWLNGLTFLAIILGTAVAGWLFEVFNDSLHFALLFLTLLSCVGTVFSLGVRYLPPAEPKRHVTFFPVREVRANLAEIWKKRGMFWSAAGLIAWWFVAALAQVTTIKMAQDSLGLEATGASRLFLYIALGIGIGSYVAGRISGQKIEVGLIPIGAFGMAVTAGAVYFVPQTEFFVSVPLFLLGFFAGWYEIPVYAYIQHHADPRTRGGILGTINFFTFLGIAASTVPFYGLLTVVLGFTAPMIFLSMGIMMVFVGCMVVAVIPGAGLRLILFIFANTIYRLRVVGRDNVPEKGGALLVCNHLSFADGLLVVASLDRPVRMVLFEEIYNHPLVRPFAVLSQAIPISNKMGPRDMITALREASEAIQSGDLVGIFAEGQITRTGQLLPFRKGLERIMKGVEAPIVPMHLDRVWGSLLSFSGKRWLLKLPKRIPWPVTVSFGAQMPAHSTAQEVRKAVLHLSSEAWRHRKSDAPLLHRDVFSSARRQPFAKCMADMNTPRGISRLKFITGVIALARAMRTDWRGQKMVGLCLPPSIPGAMLNVAALLSGKVPVNLNYTASSEIVGNIGKQCGISTVVTSRAFMEKVKVELPGTVLYAEDIAKHIRWEDRAVAFLMALFVPVLRLEREFGAPSRRSVDDIATVIFSSGSTGDPKGVMLSHWNLFSNIEAVGQVFSLSRKDAILGVLPFFHSFGFMATLMLPLSIGFPAIYHPNPLDARAVGELVERHLVTFLVATPTFLGNFTRRIEPQQFGSLQLVLTGAEKLREPVAAAFERKFGIRPYEGYGCTECSPVIAVNTHDFRAPGMFQCGVKPGKIGHPIPGVTIRIVDPETLQDLPDGQEGLILVKGPNVMLGYLGREDLTQKVITDGWYHTGDLAKIDEDGFVEITDRLARFSKIGGEMVPHIRVEEALHEAMGSSEQVFAVAGVPDAKKGERLVVVHTVSEEQARAALAKIASSGALPNLWIPRPADLHRIEAIPILGTGKMDLRAIKEKAIALSAGAGEEKGED